MIEHLEKQCWSLDTEFAKYILPRLLYFKNWTYIYSHPQDCEDIYEWNEILEELCWTFSYLLSENKASEYIDDIEIKDGLISIKYLDKEKYDKAIKQQAKNEYRCQNGLNLFAKYYRSLWN